MDMLVWVVCGLMAGWLTGYLVAGVGYAFLGDMIMGVIGAMIGGLLATLYFQIPDALISLNVPTLWGAAAGAVAMISLYRLLPGRTPV
jgi:uncharacterized membrane protein YeaQ/YmgE (transglycosylase-associated protein family)